MVAVKVVVKAGVAAEWEVAGAGAVRAAIEKVGAATAEGRAVSVRAAARVAAARGLATAAVATAEEARVEMVRLGGSRKGDGGREGRGGDKTGDNVAAAAMAMVAVAMTVEREGMVAGSAWTAEAEAEEARGGGVMGVMEVEGMVKAESAATAARKEVTAVSLNDMPSSWRSALRACVRACVRAYVRACVRTRQS